MDQQHSNITPSEEKASGSCPMSKSNFNYCFWAKFIVAIPALPLVGLMAAAPFSSPLMQAVAASVAIIIAVTVCIKIDHMALFSSKIVKKSA